ncbi:hypothetical protein DSO57_1021309 [Entomophthora muscae]|uniref:Uncharacterized protein n=1 Tax=Entomophthora muscae TaxID=34485 RepID=A0ACC2SGJ8_9FUNG|nr:hypothetical protein DSO57_1021309 [Entomophthora muscae]
MTTRGMEFIGGEFKRLFKYWYQPNDGLHSADVKVYGGYACLIIGKVLEEFAAMLSKYKPSSKKLPHLENDNPIQSAPDFDQGNLIVTEELENHSYLIVYDNYFEAKGSITFLHFSS